ncbi:molybdopterin molybdotransferase MoeA [Acetobacteraceae bacterium KSS8]|uniref:Molybdopterin molybdenumtransferase n=1 Tax=Endosaccharibacter trunci TaxID=2812733 RepID=A0ABT1WAY4_9PROT|nr:molybdopterin molybdotransferase MoeA [Acetobacteraceae bacterium KSS8]
MMDVLIDTDAADRLVADMLPALPGERIALREAIGRVLRQIVRAETAQPPFDRVMMDGVALRWRDELSRRLRVAGAQMAGEVGQALRDDDDCIDVTTGAVLPEGCDCVIPVERFRRDGDVVALEEGYDPARGQFIHRRGADCAEGAVVLEGGVRIGGPEMSMLASNGVATVEVARAPRIAIISTGDELVPVEATLRPGQIRRSNDLALAASLERGGFDRVSLHHVLDDRDAVRDSLDALLRAHDVLVLSGGVSMGQRDFVPDCLESLGVRCVLHGIAQRPGKPIWVGIGPESQAVFALPGNPVSSLVCMTRYVRPALLRASGLAVPVEYASIRGDTGKPLRLARFLPVRLESDPSGTLLAHARGWSNSGDFTALGGTHGIVELPPERSIAEGAPVRVFRW